MERHSFSSTAKPHNLQQPRDHPALGYGCQKCGGWRDDDKYKPTSAPTCTSDRCRNSHRLTESMKKLGIQHRDAAARRHTRNPSGTNQVMAITTSNSPVMENVFLSEITCTFNDMQFTVPMLLDSGNSFGWVIRSSTLSAHAGPTWEKQVLKSTTMTLTGLSTVQQDVKIIQMPTIKFKVGSRLFTFSNVTMYVVSHDCDTDVIMPHSVLQDVGSS